MDLYIEKSKSNNPGTYSLIQTESWDANPVDQEALIPKDKNNKWHLIII